MSAIKEAAAFLAQQGRDGDTQLVHMTPGEVGALHDIARIAGGELTPNPHTGLVEASFLRDILPMIASTAAGVATGGMSIPMQMTMMGLASGGTTAALGGDRNDILKSGLGGAAGGATKGLMKGALPGVEQVGGEAILKPANQLTGELTTQGASDVGGQLGQQAISDVTPQVAGDPTTVANSGGLSVVDSQPTIDNTTTMRGLSGVAPVPEGTGNAFERGTWTDWIKNNKGKTALGLGAAAMGLNEYETRRRQKMLEGAEDDERRDWNNRVRWYRSQSGPVNSRPDYDDRRRG